MTGKLEVLRLILLQLSQKTGTAVELKAALPYPAPANTPHVRMMSDNSVQRQPTTAVRLSYNVYSIGSVGDSWKEGGRKGKKERNTHQITSSYHFVPYLVEALCLG